MFNTTSTAVPSLSDIAAVTNANDNNGFLGGSGAWWVIIIFALIFGWGNWGGNGFGGYGNGGGTSALMSTFDTDYIAQGLRDIQSGLASNFLTLNNENLSGVCDIRGDIASSTASTLAAVTNGFATQNLSNLQNTNQITDALNAGNIANMQNVFGVQTTLAQMASDNRAATADTNYNIASQLCATNTANATNTRDIIDAVNSGNRAILDAMAQNKVDAMQDKIADLQAQLTNANMLASQAAQNNTLIDALAPKAPIAAYTVPNPYCNCGYRYGNMVNA